MNPSLFSRSAVKPRKVACATAILFAGVVVWLSASAWRTGHLQRSLRVLWEGEDEESRRRKSGLERVRRAKDFIDDIEKNAAEAELQVEFVTQARNTLSGAAVDDVAAGERRQSPDRKLAGLSCDIDEAFKFLDGIQGDETVRDARRAQTRRLTGLGDRIDVATKRLGRL